MATKKTVQKQSPKQPIKETPKAPSMDRVKGKAQVIYFPGAKLSVLRALEKKATKDKGISFLVIEALEKAGM